MKFVLLDERNLLKGGRAEIEVEGGNIEEVVENEVEIKEVEIKEETEKRAAKEGVEDDVVENLMIKTYNDVTTIG